MSTNDGIFDRSSELHLRASVPEFDDDNRRLARMIEKNDLRGFQLFSLGVKINIPILKIILQKHDNVNFLKECIKDSCQLYQYVKKIPELINLAANSFDPQILSYLLKLDDDIEVDSIYENLTAINSLAKNITSENFNDVFKCIQQLIDYGADPNIPDQHEMTPILNIVTNKELDYEKKKIIIKYLVDLEYPKVDIDSCIRSGNNVRTLLTSNFPDIQLPLDDTNKSHFLILPKILREKQENDFLQWFHNDRFVIKIPDDINQRKNFILCLLKIAIKNGLNKAVKVLLDRSFFNVEEAFDIGFKTACNVGNSQALKILLEQYNFNVKEGWNFLIKLIPMLNKTNENNDYIECFDILLDSSKIDAIERSLALHYAIQSNNEEATIKLFGKGSNLHAMSLEYINPEILENCFDKCITTNDVQNGGRHFEIHINYNNFQHLNSDENQKMYAQDHKIWSSYFYEGHEMLTINRIAESKHLNHLLSHPLISSLLFLKWHQLSLFFYMNLILCFCFCIFLISSIILDINNANEAFQITFKILSILGLICIILREGIQVFTLRRIMFATSFAFFSNCIEIALIVLAILTLSHSNYQNEPQRSYAVLTILLVSMETYLLVGSLPILTFSTHMLMLNAVCVSFIKSFFQYSIFFITFGLCFHIVFRKTENINTIEDADTDAGHFNSAFGSIFKTFIMVTGEFESGSINFNSPTSYAIFIFFVAFMSIILLNLLNGLAVSDTQMIRMQAELNRCICLTHLIVNFERSLTAIKNIRLFNSIFNNLTTSVQDYIQGDRIIILPRLGNKISISNPDKWYQGHYLRSSISIFLCCRRSFFRKLENCAMDLTIVRAALNVLEKKQRIQDQEKIILEQKNRLKNIEKKVEEQEIRLRNIEKNGEMILPLLQKLGEGLKVDL